MVENSNEKLFSEFPPVSTQEWDDKIIADLKGADYEKKLVWRTIEGFNVRPYYRQEDLEELGYLEVNPGEFPFVRGSKNKNNDWEVRQDIKVDDVAEANQKALFILDRGITSLGFTVPEGKITDQATLKSLLEKIYFECINLNFVAGKNSPDILCYLADEVDEKKIDSAKILGSTDYDPLGNLTVTGAFYNSEEADFKALKELIQFGVEKLPNYRVYSVNAQNFSNSGSSIVQELGFGLAQGAEYLSKMSEAGLNLADVTKQLQFVFGVGSNYFMEIAKIRAARLLWAKIVEAYLPEDKKAGKMFIHGITSDWNKTIYDPYVNMLRVTTESMSAVIGGVDSLYVQPFDKSYREVSKFSGRIARNTQIILKEEAYLDKIVDPSAGSYYIENLTNSIAEEAWKIFLSVEEKGGYLAALKEGFIQSQIKETSAKRDKLVAQKREVFLGTNQYANSLEKIEKDVDTSIAFPESKKADNAILEPITPYRGAMAFEKLRLAVEKHSKRPKAYMLTIGNLTMRKARASFSTNFFASAGYEVVDNLGFETVEDGAKAATEAGADIVVLCSSDDEYVEYAPAAFEQIKDKAIFVVAGAPACMEDLKAKGIENFIHVKTNLLEALTNYNALMGIK